MPAIIQVPFRVAAAKAFIDSFATNHYYIGLGKIDEWQPDNENPTGSDSNPNLPLDIEKNNNDTRRSLFGLKRINSSDVTLAIRRIDWTSGEVYDQYDDTDETLYTKDYYVVSSEFKIYKCVFNNYGGAVSEEPNFVSNNIIQMADGYKWKYMGEVSLPDQFKFMMNDWIPIVDDDVSVTGQIVGYRVVSGGTGYSSPVFDIVGDGSGATATGVVLSGAITKVNSNAVGSNYTYADVNITGGGSGAVIEPIISPAVGHGYSISNELAGFNCILSVKIEYDESTDFLTNNDFRQVAIIKNPLVYGGTSTFTSSTGNLTTLVEVDTVTGFNNDDEIDIRRSGNSIGTALMANIIDSGKIAITDVRSKTIIVGDTLHTILGNAVISAITYPEVNVFSGSLIYTNNRTPITRDILQTETVRIPFEF